MSLIGFHTLAEFAKFYLDSTPINVFEGIFPFPRLGLVICSESGQFLNPLLWTDGLCHFWFSVENPE
jgi:hypothetical protein